MIFLINAIYWWAKCIVAHPTKISGGHVPPGLHCSASPHGAWVRLTGVGALVMTSLLTSVNSHADGLLSTRLLLLLQLVATPLRIAVSSSSSSSSSPEIANRCGVWQRRAQSIHCSSPPPRCPPVSFHLSATRDTRTKTHTSFYDRCLTHSFPEHLVHGVPSTWLASRMSPKKTLTIRSATTHTWTSKISSIAIGCFVYLWQLL